MSQELGEEEIELIKISDSAFARRENERLFQFKPDPENKTMSMLVLNPNDGSIVSSFPKLEADEKLPIELLVEGSFDQALKAYLAIQKKDPEDPAINENQLNGLGYRYLGNDKMKIAQDIFKVNMMLYPKSFNVYDSYAEACMKMGETELAIKNYNISLSLNPENSNATEMLKKLQNK